MLLLCVNIRCTASLHSHVDGMREQARPGRRLTDDIKDWTARLIATGSQAARDKQQCWKQVMLFLTFNP